MKKNNLRKGFTIVELVIVIAVISVLAAVLIPTFINMTEKAKEASLDAKIRNLNTVLMVEEVEIYHDTNVTPFDAIKDIKKHGYTEDNLEDVVWHETDNRFYNKNKINNHQEEYFSFESSYDEDSLFSIYLLDSYIGDTISNLKVGLDVGYNSISSITVNDNRVATHRNRIRTNDTGEYITTLNVNGNNEVDHYGILKALNIIDTSIDTYIEYGEVEESISISKGKLILMNQSIVDEVNVINATNNVIIETYIPTTIKVDDTSKENTEIYSHTDNNLEIFNIDESHVHGNASIYTNVIRNEAELTNAFSTGGEYTLMNDITVNNQKILASDKSLILDLHGSYLNYSNNDNNRYIIYNYGSLSINDLKGSGGINSYRVFRNEGGTLILNGGRFTSTEAPTEGASGYIVYNNNDPLDGSLIITGGNYRTNGLMFASMHGSIGITGGTFTTIADNVNTGNELLLVANNSTVQIDGGTFIAALIGMKVQQGTLTVNGGTFYASDNPSILNQDGTTTINNGTFYTINASTFASEKGTITINNCMVTSTVTSDLKYRSLFSIRYNTQNSVLSSRINVNGGTFIHNSDTTPMIKLLDINDNYSSSPSSTSGIYISGGIFRNYLANGSPSTLLVGAATSSYHDYVHIYNVGDGTTFNVDVPASYQD